MKVSFVILVFVSVLTSSICAFICVKKIIEWRRLRNLSKSAINQDLEEGQSVKESSFSWLMRNGISFLIKPCHYLTEKIKLLDTLFLNIVVILNDRKITSNKDTVASVFVFFCIVMGILCSLLFGSFVGGIAIVLFLCVCLGTVTKALIEKKATNIRNSIPETLRSMSSCFGAGYTLYQTFQQISKETKGSIHKLFAKSTHVLQTGGSISESLHYLKSASEVPELAFVAVALDVQHQTGGSMKPVIESAKDMVESKLELLRLLQVQTAQAKLSSRIVIVLPFALVALFSIISPGFLVPFFSSFLGVVILLIAILMQAAGIILVKKMLNIKI